MSSGLLIIGAGGHGKVVADSAQQQGWQHIAFLDRDPTRNELLGMPVVGTDPAAAGLLQQFPDATVAIGDPRLRLDLLDQLERIGFRLPVIAHPRAVISQHATVQSGCVLFANAVVNPGSHLARGCIINTAATVDHDCRLEEGVHIAPGAHIAGGVHIGRESWIGTGACVREYLAIGAHVIVGAGAAVVSDIPDAQQVAGVPARTDFRSSTRPKQP